MKKLFSPKHIVITGASSGIGAAFAVHYAQKGVVLSLTGRDEERLGDVQAICKSLGARVFTQVLDVRDEDTMRDWLRTRDQETPVDMVIANAGISAGTGDGLLAEPIEQVRNVFDVNLYGVLNTIHPLIPLMSARGNGQIVIMSSLAAYNGWPGAPAYCASKAAVKIYGQSLRGSLKAAGVQVNVVCPGFVDSRMTAVNDFPMPFFMSAEKAVQLIVRGLGKNKGVISFPFVPKFLSWLFSLLPLGLIEFILLRMPKKAPE